MNNQYVIYAQIARDESETVHWMEFPERFGTQQTALNFAEDEGLEQYKVFLATSSGLIEVFRHD